MNKALEIDEVIERVVDLRSKHDLSHTIFAFPLIKSDDDSSEGEWRDSSAHIVGAFAVANSTTKHPPDKNLPILLKGVSQVEIRLTKSNVQKLMKIGVFSIYPYKGGFGSILPPEVRNLNAESTMGIACVPPFHRNSTFNLPIILEMQETARNISKVKLPQHKWLYLHEARTKELNNKENIGRKEGDDTRFYLWITQDQKCALCNRKIRLEEATIEHEMPKAMHGSNKMENLSVTCSRCNNTKGNSLPYGLTPYDRRWSNYEESKGIIIPKTTTISSKKDITK